MTKKALKGKVMVVKPESKQLTAEGLISQAIQSGASVDTLERLMTVRREIRAEKAKEEFDAAMAAFQAECPIIKKTKVVLNKDKTERYRFAPLDSIINQTRKLIEKHGFSYRINANNQDGKVNATVTVTHKMGHSEESSFGVGIDKDAYMTEPQKAASALTFAKRYAFCDAFGILTGDEDNDANTVSVDEINAAFEKLKSQTYKMNEKQAKELLGMVKKSDKYSKSQKDEFDKIIQDRLAEIKKIKAEEKRQS